MAPLGTQEFVAIFCFSFTLGAVTSGSLRQYERFDRLIPALKRTILACAAPSPIMLLIGFVGGEGWTKAIHGALLLFCGLLLWCGLPFLLGSLVPSQLKRDTGG